MVLDLGRHLPCVLLAASAESYLILRCGRCGNDSMANGRASAIAVISRVLFQPTPAPIYYGDLSPVITGPGSVVAQLRSMPPSCMIAPHPAGALAVLRRFSSQDPSVWMRYFLMV